jgi:hypothetical protein
MQLSVDGGAPSLQQKSSSFGKQIVHARLNLLAAFLQLQIAYVGAFTSSFKQQLKRVDYTLTK